MAHVESRGGFLGTHSWGMLLLAVWLILMGLGMLVDGFVIPDVIMGLLALISGVLILIGR